jgi:hypothetical protein
MLNEGFRALYVGSHNGAQDVVLVAICRLTNWQLLSRVTSHASPHLQEHCHSFWRTLVPVKGALLGICAGRKTKDMHLQPWSVISPYKHCHKHWLEKHNSSTHVHNSALATAAAKKGRRRGCSEEDTRALSPMFCLT